MTPIGPNDQVDEKDVINVQQPDGTTQRYHRRRMGGRIFKNGKPSNDFYEVAIRYFTVVKASAAALVALGALYWLINDRIIMPQQERMIERIVAEQATKFDSRFTANEQAFQSHLLDIANQRTLYPTKMELKQDIAEIKAALEEIKRRQ